MSLLGAVLTLEIEMRGLPWTGRRRAGDGSSPASWDDIVSLSARAQLGREPLQTDLASVTRTLEGARVLVTGAGGSIGSELCRQLDRLPLEHMLMVDRDESALHALQLSLEGQGLLDNDRFGLVDIRDRVALERMFRSFRPEVVVHAAALKHLPLLERHPAEALKTNVWGTLNVLEAAVGGGATRFVNISSDKAADPSSVLGYSKRVAERLTADVAVDTGLPFVSVRFGNVLGSRGSVLDAFRAQCASGLPLTVTDPAATRYFMTISEAGQLVLQAAVIGMPGEVLVLDMDEPVRILDLAKRVAGAHPKPVSIVFTGLRQGEKLHECILARGELGRVRSHPLVTHVDVPALSADTVREIDESSADVAAVMREWCDAAGGFRSPRTLAPERTDLVVENGESILVI